MRGRLTLRAKVCRGANQAGPEQLLPETIDYEATVKLLSIDPSPLNVVLLQEVEINVSERYFIRNIVIELTFV